jgi:competence protein ComFC
MKTIFDNIWRYIVDIFVDDTWEKLTFQNTQIRDLTEHYRVDFPNIALDRVLVAVEYMNIEDILESYKYHSERSHVHVFVNMLSWIIEWEDIWDAIIITVPMHWSRYTLRGFDHMDYLARRLSKSVDIPYIQPLSTAFSRRQSKLSRQKRLENRKNHFTIDNSITLPRKVILIDDVISTGATAHECAKLLKKHGAGEVIGVFLASSAQP